MNRKIGISLIVLVITIIIIIILAGSVILSLANNNPIASANKATFETNIATYNSELAMAVSNQYLQNNLFDTTTFNAGVWNGNESNITGTIKQYITSIKPEDGVKFEIQKSKLVYVGSEQIEKDWLTEMGIANGDITPPEEPQYTALGIDVIATENATVNGLVASYNNPIIPKGFKAVNSGTVWPTDWNTGLVIEDVSGNQFVWVPVDGTNVSYTKWCTTGFSYATTTDDTLPAGVVSESVQVTNYGGFYIARYEAGNSSNVLVSKKSVTVWSDINYTNAKLKAESMYTTAEVKSGLVTGTQWDTVMKWVENSGKNITNSTTWGNHNDSVAPANVTGWGSKHVTGFSEFWKANNIYDLAGNTFEWTNEIYFSTRVGRGGSYYDNGSSFTGGPVSGRNGHDITFNHSSYSFREVLYIL